jgi:hypothetical protein
MVMDIPEVRLDITHLDLVTILPSILQLVVMVVSILLAHLVVNILLARLVVSIQLDLVHLHMEEEECLMQHHQLDTRKDMHLLLAHILNKDQQLLLLLLQARHRMVIHQARLNTQAGHQATLLIINLHENIPKDDSKFVSY